MNNEVIGITFPQGNYHNYSVWVCPFFDWHCKVTWLEAIDVIFFKLKFNRLKLSNWMCIKQLNICEFQVLQGRNWRQKARTAWHGPSTERKELGTETKSSSGQIVFKYVTDSCSYYVVLWYFIKSILDLIVLTYPSKLYC